ncbi:hypothetical protein [Alteromonas antoniana]|uniref:hypothetical protein n=1 Tax=Alteromonas antoniana TaxID=2803813 RepID=UPI001C48FDD6|nr:hypothetical protein [Alteromonas antoniana]
MTALTSTFVNTTKKNKGFTFTEFAIVAVLMAAAAYFIYPALQAGQQNAKVDDALRQVSTLLSAAQKYGPKNGDKTGISMQAIAERGLIPDTMGTGANAGVGANPWNGDITMAVDTADQTQVEIEFQGIDDDEAGLRFEDELNGSYAESASYASGTLTLILNAG